MKVEYVETSALVPYPGNAKKHDETQVRNVAESIDQYGFVQPIVIDSENVVVIGHCRLEAAKELGYGQVPCLRVDELTPQQVDALRIVDNKTNESEWDWDLLETELDELDLEAFDFEWDYPAPEDVPDEEILEDDVPEPEEVEPRAKLGDVYILGDHRVMCGDATKERDVEKLMAGAVADLWLTDPPYNVALGQNGGHKLRPSEAKQLHRRTDGLVIENDSWESPEEFEKFLEKAFTVARDNLKDGGVYYIWHAHNFSREFHTAIQEVGLPVKECLIWNKNTFAMGRQDYQWKHEPCIYGWKPGAAHFFVDDRTQSTVFEDEKPNIKAMKKSEMVELLEQIFDEKVSTTVLDCEKPSRSCEHPTMKPIKLLAKQIKNSSRGGEIVLDTFGGSGSTLITCEQLGRKCYTMELDPKYVDVIVKRWEDFTGRKAVQE